MTYNPSLNKQSPHSLIQNLQNHQRNHTSTPQRNTTSGRVNRNAITSANLTMSIKEQQAIQDILKEMRSHQANSGKQSKGEKDGGNFDYSQITEFGNDSLLDYDLQQMLKQSEQQLSKQYQTIAKQQFAKNRMSIAVDDEQDKLQEIFARMDIRSEVSKQSQSEEQVKMNLKYGMNLQVKKRKQSTFSRDMSQEGSYVRSFDQKSQGFGSAFNLDENKLKLHYGFDDSFIQENKTSGRARSYTTNLQMDPQKGQDNTEENSSSDSQQQKTKSKKKIVQQSGKCKAVSEKEQYILDKFQKDEICKPKQQSLQILQLDQKYPKINPMSMYKYQYPIFNITESSTNKYLRFLKREVQDITCATSFFVGAQKWTILGIDYLLYVFIGDKWKEPLIVNPQRSSSSISKAITVLAVSPSVNYLALGLGSQIIIYQIKKQTNLLVLVKNLNSSDDLNAKLVKVNKIVFYDENPIKLVYNDNDENVAIITVEQNMLYTKVSEKNIDHGLDIVMDFDVLCIDTKSKAQKQEIESPSKGFSFNKMLNQKLNTFISKSQVCYLALASTSKLILFIVEPSLQLLYMQNFQQQTNNQVSLRWRYNRQVQLKPQLLISYHNKIFIYKLFQTDLGNESKNKSKEVSLQLHLMYQNHYNIKQMEIISNTHLLLYSNENIIVIAIPLITSTHLTEDKHDLDMFESALVWITSQKNLRILFASPQEIIYFGSKKQTLRLACLRSLQEYLDELMLQQGHFRQAFTLLILIFKGVNYSFKFSYTSEALSQCIFSAVQCTIGSLILSMDDNIAEYRLGWVCQLLLQTHNEQMIWTTVYKKLKDKQKQRQKEEYTTKRNLEESDEICKTEGSIPGEDYYEHFIKTQAQSIKKTISKRQSSESHSNLLKNRQMIVRHHSMVMQHTTSSKLGFENHKTLEEILFNILEVFVLKSQVTSMPEQIFLQFVAYECQKKSDTVVEKAIIQNKAEYDGSKLLSLLHSKERNYLQFYLFSRALVCEEPDFYTPFIKVFSSFKQSMEQIQRRSKNDQQLLKKAEKIGMMCLWFIRKCFKFERVPSGAMPLNEKLMIISTMCTQLLEPTFTIRLFRFQPKIFLQIYLLFFVETELSQLIEQHNEMLVEKYKQFFPSIYQQIMSAPPSSKSNDESKEKELQVFDKSFKELAVLHLQLTIPAIKNQKFVWSEFLATVYYCNKSQMGLKFEVTVDILIVLFQNKFEQYQLEIPNKIFRPSIEELELTLIEHIKPTLLQKKDRFYLNKLISLNDKNVSYYLCRLDQSYKQSLEYFMASKQPEKMIPFIHQLLQDVQEIGKNNSDNQIDKSIRERKIGEIRNFLVKNVTYLFKIDKYGALNVFYEIGETSQTIYSVIQESMGQKLNFLTAVLKKFQNQDFQMKERFQLEHLSEVCRLKDKQMLEYLDKFFYPLDQAIIVCEQKGNLLAKAILQQRCGKINEAFMSYERIVKNIISSNSSQKEIRSERQVKRDMRKYTEQCIRLCKQYSQDPNSNQQSNFWLRIITFINGFIKSKSQHKVFLKVEFEKVLQHILTEMFEFLPTNILVQFFITKGYKLELSTTKQFSIFQNLFVLSKFDMGVAKKVVEICRIDNKDTRKEALSKRKNGIKCNGYCDFCKKQLAEDPCCIIYACKHSFHKLCHDDPFKCLTCYCQSDNSVLQSNIFGPQLVRSSLEHQIFDSEPPKQKKKLKQISKIEIIVESAAIARNEATKKKLKLHDFTCQQQNLEFYSNINYYNEKEKARENLNKMQKIETQYVKYTKAGGLEIKDKEKFKINEEEYEKMSKDRKDSDSLNEI